MRVVGREDAGLDPGAEKVDLEGDSVIFAPKEGQRSLGVTDLPGPDGALTGLGADVDGAVLRYPAPWVLCRSAHSSLLVGDHFVVTLTS